MKTLKFKKLHEDAVPPTHAYVGDLGYDLYALYDYTVPEFGVVSVRTGISFIFPEGWGGFIKDRSGIASNGTLRVAGGVIDESYTGEVIVIMGNFGKKPILIKKGLKCAQLVPIPVSEFILKECTNIEERSRGNKGFGSTGDYV